MSERIAATPPTEIHITIPAGTWKAEYGSCLLESLSIPRDPARFIEGCRMHCPRYNKKYSCPPHAPSFDTLAKNQYYTAVYYLKMELHQLPYTTESRKLHLGSLILRSRIDRALRILEKQNPGTRMLACSPCRLCRTCTAPLNKPCKKPGKIRFSLQSCGVDVTKILEEHFNITIEWTWNTPPRFTVAVGALLLPELHLPPLPVIH